MDQAEQPKFCAILFAVASSCRMELSDIQVELYWEALSSVTMADFRRAMTSFLGARFFPSIQEIRRKAGADADPEHRSILAWEQVVSAISAYGYSNSVDFQDRAINATIRSMGGWEQLCVSDADWLQKFGAAQFKKIYACLLAQGFPEDLGRALDGHRWDVPSPPKLVAAPSLVARALPPPASLQLPAPEPDRRMSREVAREAFARLADKAEGKAAEFLRSMAGRAAGGGKP